MKTIVYLPLVFVLLLAEGFAAYQFIAVGEQNFQGAVIVHLTVAVLFGVLTGIHRRSLPVALLSILVVGTTPLVGIITMTLLDDKFNREASQNYFESSENFEIGNPFISLGGNVEISSNESLLSEEDGHAMQRVLQVDYELSEREVEALSHDRSIDNLPLLEKIASSASGEGQVLAQAAIAEITDRTTIWSANLHRLQIHQQPIPVALERLAVTTFIKLKKQGRNPQSFGLPEEAELVGFLQDRIASHADAQTVKSLFEVLILAGNIEQATQLIEAHKALPGLNYPSLQAVLHSSKGEWIDLLRSIPDLTLEEWLERSSGVRRFWGIEQANHYVHQ